MSNIHKLVRDLDKTHLSKAEKNRRTIAESLLSRDITDLKAVTDDKFINACAKKEYFCMLEAFREDDRPLNNLNMADLIAYANSYAHYINLIKLSKKVDLTYTIGGVEKPHPVFRMMGEAQRAMQQSLMCLGIFPGRNNKTAAQKAEDKALEVFNDI